jgi:hypothetical protein
LPLQHPALRGVASSDSPFWLSLERVRPTIATATRDKKCAVQSWRGASSSLPSSGERNWRGSGWPCARPASELGQRRPAGQLLSPCPSGGFGLHLGFSIAGKGELARVSPVLILVDHSANRLGVVTTCCTVDDHLRHGSLANLGFSSSLEVNRLRQTSEFLWCDRGNGPPIEPRIGLDCRNRKAKKATDKDPSESALWGNAGTDRTMRNHFTNDEFRQVVPKWRHRHGRMGHSLAAPGWKWDFSRTD